MSLTPFDAVMICEGEQPAEEEEVIEAWQYLIDTGTVNHLQGWYGRTAHHLIREGVCTPPGGGS